MYWIYLALFILVIFTPTLVDRGVLFLGEEDAESLLIFCFGMIGLLLYLGKESALIRSVKEKLFLQRETNQIRKDLSQSYSYIGEMNRRFDIVKNSLIALPSSALRVFSHQKDELYQPIFDAAQLITKSSRFRLLFVSTLNGSILEKYDTDDAIPAALLEGKRFLDTKKFSWEEEGFSIVRSPEDAFETAAFLLFEKASNRLDATEVLQILAAEALVLYSIDRKKFPRRVEQKGGE